MESLVGACLQEPFVEALLKDLIQLEPQILVSSCQTLHCFGLNCFAPLPQFEEVDSEERVADSTAVLPVLY